MEDYLDDDDIRKLIEKMINYAKINDRLNQQFILLNFSQIKKKIKNIAMVSVNEVTASNKLI